MEEIRNQADSGGSTAGRNGAPRAARLCSGVASGRASACSHQRSPAPAAGATAVQPALAGPSTDSTLLTVMAGLSPAANTDLRDRTFKEHLPCSLPGKREQGPGPGPQPVLQEACSEHSIPGYCQRSSLCSQLPSQRHFPRKRLSYSSFFVLESSTGQAVPQQTTSIQNGKHILFKPSRVESSH